MKRIIKEVAVLGSGIIGSRITSHCVNIGLNVLVLDNRQKEIYEEQKKKGLIADSPAIKNSIVNTALQNTIKTNPSPLYKKSFASMIRTGNFTDNMKDIATAD